MSPEVKKILLQALDNVISFKFLTLALASVFFVTGHLAANLWVEVCLIVAGLRTATDLMAIHRSKPSKNRETASNANAKFKP